MGVVRCPECKKIKYSTYNNELDKLDSCKCKECENKEIIPIKEKSRKDIIIKSILIVLLMLIFINIFFKNEIYFIKDLLSGDGLEYCITCRITDDEYEIYGKNLSEDIAKQNINDIINNANTYSYKQVEGTIESHGKTISENNFYLEYQYAYSNEKNIHKLEVVKYEYKSEDIDTNIIKQEGTYTIATIDNIEYIFINTQNDKKVIKASDNIDLYNAINSFSMKSQFSKMLANNASLKSAKTYKTGTRYQIQFDTYDSAITLYTYGKNVLSCYISIHTDDYNYNNNMGFKLKNVKIDVPKLEDYK